MNNRCMIPEGYMINTKDGVLCMTPVQIYDRVISDSLNNVNEWYFKASELVRVVSMTDFPVRYRRDIHIAVMNHFTDLELAGKSVADDNDQAALNYIYNRFVLYEEKEKDLEKLKTRKNYLRAMIRKAAMSVDIPDCYDALRDKWIDDKFKQYEDVYGANFTHLNEVLVKDFRAFIYLSESVDLLGVENRRPVPKQNVISVNKKPLV